MTGRRVPPSPDDDAIFSYHCETILTREGAAVAVPDEAVYAYVGGRATDEQRTTVEDAMLASRSFCDELLEIAEYLDQFEPAQRRGKSPERRRGFFAWRPRFAMAAAVAAVVLVTAVTLVVRWRAPGRLPEALHLVVLPIECEGDAVSGAFCDGLAETVTHKVSLFERFNPSFWVVPAEAVAKAKVSDPRAAGNRFGATMALTGEMQHLRDEFRLTLNLVNLASPTLKTLRSAEITGPMTDLATLQVAVVQRVGRMLDMQRMAQASKAFDEGNTDVSEAYERYVEGRGHLLRYEQTAELESAADAFTSAIAADSAYALAYTGLAEAYWRMYRAVGDTQWIARARDECARSLALDTTLAATHVVFGNVMNESGEYEAAVGSFRRALAIDSTAAGAYNGLATSYDHLGRPDDAEATYRRAIGVKPDYWGGYNDLGLFYYLRGRFDEATEQYRRVAELTPDNYLAFNNLGAMYYYLERWDEARSAFQTSINIQPNDRAYLNVGSVYYIEGDYETAARLCEQAVSLNDTNYKSWAAVANAYYWLPNGRDRAMEAYQRAIQLAESHLALNRKDVRARASLAGYYAVVGEREKALAYADSALASSSDSPFVVYFAGYVHEQLGDRSRALELIGRAVELGYPIREIERDPWLVDLRADERFQQLLDKRK